MEIDRRYIYDILLENLENELKDEEYTDWQGGEISPFNKITHLTQK